MSVAKGAQIFERHVGVETDSIKLNAYSSTPSQVDAWVQAILYAQLLNGSSTPRPIPESEVSSIDSLRRGVYMKKLISKP
jgi:N-acetylneuraminate synthase